MKILLITLSNIGDAILTTGVLDGLKEKFPDSDIDVIAGVMAGDVFSSDNRVNEVIIYDKKASFFKKVALFKQLKARHYSFVVDLRNTLGSYFVSRHVYKTKNVKGHRYIKHNTSLGKFFAREKLQQFKPHIIWSPADEEHIDSLKLQEYIVISPAARSDTKSWPADYFKKTVSLLRKHFPEIEIVLTAQDEDREFCRQFVIDSKVKNLAGQTNIKELGALISKARLVITNDSAALHTASATGAQTLAIFGPTSEIKYGPLSTGSLVLRKHYPCSPCEKAQCIFGDKRCLLSIKPEEVFNFAARILEGKSMNIKSNYKRILLSRVDKIGDLILTTPAIEVVRKNFPNSFISFLSGVETEALIKNNPYLDEVITLDKKGKHKGILGFLKILSQIRKRKFDLAINFHPANRVHLLCFLSRISSRVGYDWKLGRLNNYKVKHIKQLGKRSEADYNFDLLARIGINEVSHNQTIIVDRSALSRIDNDLRNKNIGNFIIIHPGASCKSKLWPLENFIALAKKIIEEKHLKIIFILGPYESSMKKDIEDGLGSDIRIYQDLKLEDLIALLFKADVLISNDSGPMHIADAFSKPLIAIFGRIQPGLSFRRWGPLNKNAVIIHKDVGCRECLAHNCRRNFLCLRAITADDVYKEFERISRPVIK